MINLGLFMGYAISKTEVLQRLDKKEKEEKLEQEFKNSLIKNQSILIEQNKSIIDLLQNILDK